MKLLLGAMGLAWVLSSAGCLFGTSGSEGSCQTDGQCVNWVFSSETWRLDLIRDNCEGTWSPSASCSTTDLAGICTFNGEFARSEYHYAADTYTQASAELACTTEVNGTFEPR